MRILRAVIIVLIILLLTGSVAYAIADPDSPPVINQANVYRHLIETDDQLYLVVFDLDIYAANPSESATEAFLVRIRDSANVTLSVVAPYSNADCDDGYDTGCIGIYFASDDANLPTWSDNLTIELVGNPSLSWAGDPPGTSTTDITWSTSTTIATTSSELTARVRFMANAFENDWAVDLIETVSGSGTKLTSNGEDYLTNAIPYLYNVCPDIFSATVIVPSFEKREYTQTYATTMENRWIGDPFLDFTAMGTSLGISRIWVSSIIWMAFTTGVCIFVGTKVMSYKGSAFLFCLMIVVGACIGLMPFVAGIIIGVLGLLAVIYTLAWGGAT